MASAPSVFTSAIDIANRACQHVGAQRITAFTDDSRQAAEMDFCYDKLRQGELRRNVWRFAVRKARLWPLSLNSLAPTAGAWSNGTTYAVGQIAGSDGLLWQSTVSGNIGNTPGDDAVQWQLYFGAQNLEPWDATQTYTAGDTVYLPQLWASTISFAMSAQCVYNGVCYQSSIANNQTQPDLNSTSAYNSATNYAAGALVTESATTYQSLINNNIGNDPASSPSDWAVYTGTVAWTVVGSPTFTGYLSLASSNADRPGSNKWLSLNATLSALSVLYPVTVGPVQDTQSFNAFLLPHYYLRQAPDSPKQGSTSFLGSSTGLQYQDYVFENNMFTTRLTGPIMFRFVADCPMVSQMDPMFCEGLAARMGLETCETLTQSRDKINGITQEYMKFMGEARTVNGIEEGPTEPPEDDWIVCRI